MRHAAPHTPHLQCNLKPWRQFPIKGFCEENEKMEVWQVLLLVWKQAQLLLTWHFQKCQTLLLSHWKWLNLKSLQETQRTEPSTMRFSTLQLISPISRSLRRKLLNGAECTWNSFLATKMHDDGQSFIQVYSRCSIGEASLIPHTGLLQN